jgi:hypothetical protein
MKVTRIIATAAMSAVLAGTAQAQALNCTGTTSAGPTNCSVTNTVNVSVPYVASLQVSSATTNLTAPTAANFGASAGVSDANAISLTVKANSSYKVTASAAAATWTGGTHSKSAGDLKLSIDNFSTTSALSTAGVQIASGASATASSNISIGYNVVYNWTTDAPGAYSLAVNYTLTSP